VILLGFVQHRFKISKYVGYFWFIGASFVITQFQYLPIMFCPNIVGTGQATFKRLGNLGGGANRLGMPF